MNDNPLAILRSLHSVTLRLGDGGRLDSELWQTAGFPLGNGQYWMYEDKNAIVGAGEKGLKIEIPLFSHSHDQVQIFDNPKHLILSRSSYQPGEKGIVAFSCRMKSRLINGDHDDYRDGFASFNVLDFATAMVFDIIANGHHVWAIYERLMIPGYTSDTEAFTRVIPIEKTIDPDTELNCLIVYDSNENEVNYFVDEKPVFTANDLPVKIKSLQTGFGLITLHPITNGKSVSCRGQGGIGIWNDIKLWR